MNSNTLRREEPGNILDKTPLTLTSRLLQCTAETAAQTTTLVWSGEVMLHEVEPFTVHLVAVMWCRLVWGGVLSTVASVTEQAQFLLSFVEQNFVTPRQDQIFTM